ncbi:MAG: hypothetical protein A2X97_15615 [Bdellovibrionales bacterium GWA1_52_35]|nr:MAG: hypothetical protein A2X97_15615 [Bdellovibrionales bacterium GWA1_52_35]HCM39740.1 hypothetical protein [Bdellovibrionales bacterium]
MSIQITSMADIFMILLVFLLKSYGSGLIEISTSKDLTMPQAVAESGSVDALKVEISEKVVLLEGKPVAEVRNFEFDGKSLAGAFAGERKRQQALAKTDSGVKADARVIMIADRNIPYSTIKSVLASAASNGYTDFKLAVVQTN